MLPTFAPGDSVLQRYRKYDGTRHWHFDTFYLGRDQFGCWLGGRAGDVYERPGWRFVSTVDSVMLVPENQWFVATFNQPGGKAQAHTYIDLMSVAEWEGNTVRAIDLDLDVIRDFDGRIWLDDEDEFEDHRVRFGYPDDLVRTVRHTADQLLADVRADAEPYASVYAEWQDHWARLRS